MEVIRSVFETLPQSRDPDLIFEHNAHCAECEPATRRCESGAIEPEGVPTGTHKTSRQDIAVDEHKTRNGQNLKPLGMKCILPCFSKHLFSPKNQTWDRRARRAQPLSKSICTQEVTDAVRSRLVKLGSCNVEGEKLRPRNSCWVSAETENKRGSRQHRLDALSCSLLSLS